MEKDLSAREYVTAGLTGGAGWAQLVEIAVVARAERDPLLDQVLDDLAGRAGAGDEAALELLLELVHRLGLHRPAITSVIMDPGLVDDAAQLTLVAVERGIASFGGRSKFRTWLHSVARNEALMGLRRRRDEPVEEPPEASARFSSIVVGRMTIENLVDDLPEPYGATLRLQIFENLDYETISMRLGVPVGTVRSRLAKAKELMRQRLQAARGDAAMVSRDEVE